MFVQQNLKRGIMDKRFLLLIILALGLLVSVQIVSAVACTCTYYPADPGEGIPSACSFVQGTCGAGYKCRCTPNDITHACNSGSCVCTAANACTPGSSTACTSTTYPYCTFTKSCIGSCGAYWETCPATATQSCTDGNACTVGDYINCATSSTCISGAPKTCTTPANTATTCYAPSTCNTGTGACVNNVIPCPCVITSTSLSSGTFGKGQTITATIIYTGDCSAANIAQIDLKSADGSCIIQNTGSPMQGLTKTYSTLPPSPFTYTYTVPTTISDECAGKILTVTEAALYKDSLSNVISNYYSGAASVMLTQCFGKTFEPYPKYETALYQVTKTGNTAGLFYEVCYNYRTYAARVYKP